MNTQPTMQKAERQRLVVSLVTRKRLATQFELMDALAAAGCSVTQATVSRDIRELGLVKIQDALGRPRYAVAAQRTRATAPDETLRRILGEFARGAVAARNIVVLHSELGTAPAVARALDRVGHPLVVGTLAGDDTVLVVARDEADARTLARELGAAVGHREDR
jgi:transcriptional regulator of arginine metabolism